MSVISLPAPRRYGPGVFAAAFLALFFAAVPCSAAPLACPNIPVLKCLGAIEKSYSVSIQSNIDFGDRVVDISLTEANPVKAVQAIIGLTDLSNYTVSQDSVSKVITILDITKSDKPVVAISSPLPAGATKPAQTAPSAQSAAATPAEAGQAHSPMDTPSPEQWAALREQAKKVEEDLDRRIDIPGLDASKSITVRQYLQLQEQATARANNPRQPLPLPNVSGDQGVTYGQALERQKQLDNEVDKRSKPQSSGS